jgi:hypothetical protein
MKIAFRWYTLCNAKELPSRDPRLRLRQSCRYDREVPKATSNKSAVIRRSALIPTKRQFALRWFLG